MQRTEGFYWVKRADVPEVGLWLDGAWLLTASRAEFDDDDFEWIGDRIVEPTF